MTELNKLGRGQAASEASVQSDLSAPPLSLQPLTWNGTSQVRHCLPL